MDSNENNQFESLCKLLKSLQEVKAPSDFEVALFQKIDSREFTFTEISESIWSRFFSHYKLVPSAALAILAVLIIYFFNVQTPQKENPFAIQPKVRKDVITADPFSSGAKIKSEVEEKEESQASNNQSQSQNLQEQSPTLNSQLYSNHQLNVLTASTISKSGLNFRHINPNLNQRKEVYELKKRLEQFFSDDSLLK
jgi:hypothetical protein